MRWFGFLLAIVLLGIVFVDVFEAILLPRRIAHSYRLARWFYRSLWSLWRTVAGLLPAGRIGNTFLSVFGPLSLILLTALWAGGFIVVFGLLHWSLGTELTLAGAPVSDLADYAYFSGTTFLTLGYGDIVPTGSIGRALSVAEAGFGFGFLAVVISYLPVLYQAFSRREIAISLLDARAGSPPTAGELLRRLGLSNRPPDIANLLMSWETWCAELLESQLSFPVLRYYRSQHDNQSWVAALTTILDTSALLVAVVESEHDYQARLTFAMARHAAVDLSMVSDIPPRSLLNERLTGESFDRLHASLKETAWKLREPRASLKALHELKSLYEPFLAALADDLMLVLPGFRPDEPPVDNWQKSAWMPRAADLGGLPTGGNEDHFD